LSNNLDLKPYIRNVPDFPVPGILFRDITPLLREPAAYAQALDALTAFTERCSPNCIAGIEARGFLFATPVAARLGLPFVPIRKPEKLPFEKMTVEYALEYGTGYLDIHSDALSASDRVVIIDDLIATGGTAVASAQLVEILGARVAGIAFVIELAELQGRQRLEKYETTALLKL
jgi:adenine phosphoribosyltransferase